MHKRIFSSYGTCTLNIYGSVTNRCKWQVCNYCNDITKDVLRSFFEKLFIGFYDHLPQTPMIQICDSHLYDVQIPQEGTLTEISYEKFLRQHRGLNQ